MTFPSRLQDAHDGLGRWCILHAYRGSIAHGTYEPPTEPNSIDDKDTMAVCVPPAPYYFGLRQYGSRGTVEIKEGEWDVVIYEARKVVGMLAKGNPNVLSLLWVPDAAVLTCTNAGSRLREARSLFSGRWVYHSFVGYANGQLHRMTHGAHQGYMGEKRKALVARHGYDTKNASHLIRLLRMGIEFLTDGVLRVDRGGIDATELLDIKHGHFTLEQVKAKAESLFALAQEAYVRSSLPVEIDRAAVDQLCVDVVERSWYA